MKKFVLLLLFFFVQAHSLALKDKLALGETGDFIVTEQNKSLTLLKIHSIQGQRLTLEEVSLPLELGLQGKNQWEDWIMRGAPGNTSWHMFEIDLGKGAVLSCYSFSKQAWLLGFGEESIFLKLLSCPLDLIPREERRKIGPPPMDGPDHRKLWNPPMFVDGKEEKNASFQSYKLICPDGDYPLSGKRLEFYFAAKDTSFPFPYWARVTDDSGASFKIHVKDSGRGLRSPFKGLPAVKN